MLWITLGSWLDIWTVMTCVWWDQIGCWLPTTYGECVCQSKLIMLDCSHLSAGIGKPSSNTGNGMSEKPIAGDDKNADYKEVFSHWRHLVPVPPCPFGKSKTFAHAADVQERRKAMRVVTSDGVNVDPLQQEE